MEYGRNPNRQVIRIGDTVRRPAGYWTPAVHALLNHLEAAGFEGVPRVLGTDSDTEILSFVAGDTPGQDAADWTDSEMLASIGAFLRAYHDAVASFIPPHWAQWQPTSGPTTGTLVCHNDLCPGNVVIRGRRAAGIIDFDFAHPADPVWDVAVAAWHWVPFSADSMGGQVPESEWPGRLRIFVDSYGLPPQRRREILPVIAELTRQMRENRARDDLATSRFDLSLDALHRQWKAMLNALT